MQAKVEDNTQALKLKPNIYFIILDMYARQDVLKDQLGIDNSEFLKGMEARGSSWIGNLFQITRRRR